MRNELGLYNDDFEQIISILQSIPEVLEAIVFGSRAKGNFNNGSDMDIAIKGKDVDVSAISHLSYLLNEETMMPYKFDVLNYHEISNSHLKDHINRVGKMIYRRQNGY